MVPSFVANLARGGDAPALVFPNRWVITYAELAQRVDRQAQRFGTGKRLVAVEARPSEHAIIAYLAALKMGHAVALLPPNDPGAESRFEAALRPDCRYRLIVGRWRTAANANSRHPDDTHPAPARPCSNSDRTAPNRSVRALSLHQLA